MTKGLKLILISMSVSLVLRSHTATKIDIGTIQALIYDTGIQSHIVGWDGKVDYTRNHAYTPGWKNGGLMCTGGQILACKNWTDTTGKVWDYTMSGCPFRGDPGLMLAVPDERGVTIKRYFRYGYPRIYMENIFFGDTRFPSEKDEVNPDKVWGTADVMTESHIRTSMGVDIYARCLGWGCQDHDDYVIWDWTFVNTGNVDLDSVIELPGQVLDSFYFARHHEMITHGTDDVHSWLSWEGCTPDPDDSLRIVYVYPWNSLEGTIASVDNFGQRSSTHSSKPAWLDASIWSGEAVLYAPPSTDVAMGPSATGPDNHPETNNMAKPHMRMIPALIWFGTTEFTDTTSLEHNFSILARGIAGIQEDHDLGAKDNSYLMDSVYTCRPNTYFQQPPDRLQELDFDRWFISYDPWDITEVLGGGHWFFNDLYSLGPYHLEFGDSLRIVWAVIGGGIIREYTWSVGESWRAGTAKEDYFPATDSAEIYNRLVEYYPYAKVFVEHPEAHPEAVPTLNDMCKDMMVCTGKDSLFTNGMNAQRNFNLNYNVPASPLPPEEVRFASAANFTSIDWLYGSGTPSDIEGFIISRASGNWEYDKTGGVEVGRWTVIDTIPAEAGKSDYYEYRDYETRPDNPPSRNVDYYYQVVAYNSSGVKSSRWLTMSKSPISVKGGVSPDTSDTYSLTQIRVVPNPCNIEASHVQYTGTPDKIVFQNLPQECTIYIFNEAADLITTIEHTDGSASEAWGEFSGGQRYQVTDSDQTPAPGLYIAHIETPDGRSVNKKFIIIR
jgi:hypothetical protein